jgi:hypothetical protein
MTCTMPYYGTRSVQLYECDVRKTKNEDAAGCSDEGGGGKDRKKKKLNSEILRKT